MIGVRNLLLHHHANKGFIVLRTLPSEEAMRWANSSWRRMFCTQPPHIPRKVTTKLRLRETGAVIEHRFALPTEKIWTLGQLMKDVEIKIGESNFLRSELV